MPTKLRRFMVTETPTVARRLDVAARHFPSLAYSRKELLLRLTELGERALPSQPADDEPRAAAKRRILARTGAISESRAAAMLETREADWRHELEA